MGQSPRYATIVLIYFAVTSAAHATVACKVISSTAGAKNANLYSDPDDVSEIIREIPLGDLVRYPDDDLAPIHADGWIWVRHDITQENIWQSGIYGWMKPENTTDCG